MFFSVYAPKGATDCDMSACVTPPLQSLHQAAASHYETWKYYQSTSEAHQVLQTLIVPNHHASGKAINGSLKRVMIQV